MKAGRSWPSSGSRSKRYSGWSLKKTLPRFQDTPLSTIAWPTPRRSQISSVRLEKQMAREPVDSRQSLSSRSEEHTSELQSPCNLVCRLLLEKKKCKEQFSVLAARDGTLNLVSMTHRYMFR